MAAVTGILESALYVADLARSLRFYQELFGFEQMLEMSDLPRSMLPGGRCCCCSAKAVRRKGADLGWIHPAARRTWTTSSGVFDRGRSMGRVASTNGRPRRCDREVASIGLAAEKASISAIPMGT